MLINDLEEIISFVGNFYLTEKEELHKEYEYLRAENSLARKYQQSLSAEDKTKLDNLSQMFKTKLPLMVAIEDLYKAIDTNNELEIANAAYQFYHEIMNEYEDKIDSILHEIEYLNEEIVIANDYDKDTTNLEKQLAKLKDSDLYNLYLYAQRLRRIVTKINNKY